MKIAVLKGCRSDTGLINPVLKRLKEDKFFEVSVVNLVASDYATSYAKMDWYLKHNTPDLVFIPADRIEMIAGATCCFLYRIPIAHLYGGITNHPLSITELEKQYIIYLMQLEKILMKYGLLEIFILVIGIWIMNSFQTQNMI